MNQHDKNALERCLRALTTTYTVDLRCECLMSQTTSELRNTNNIANSSKSAYHEEQMERLWGVQTECCCDTCPFLQKKYEKKKKQHLASTHFSEK